MPQTIDFAHKGRTPKNKTREELTSLFLKMESLCRGYFNNPIGWEEKGWNSVDIGMCLLGSEQLERKLFPPHPSGKPFLDRTNPFVSMYIAEAEQFMKEKNLVLIDGLAYEKEVSNNV